MKRIISSILSLEPEVEYNVILDFNGYPGSEIDLIVYASKYAEREDLQYIIEQDYADDLLEGKVIDSDEEEGYYEVEVAFDGQIGTSETYSVYANDESEAIYEAIEEAKDDINVVDFYEL